MTPTLWLILALALIAGIGLAAIVLPPVFHMAWRNALRPLTPDPINEAIAQADADLETARADALRERAYWYGSAPPPSRAQHHRRGPITAPGGHRIHAGNVVPLPQRGAKPTTGKPS